MYTLGQLDEHNWACTLPTVLTRDVAKLAISFLSVLIPRKFDCLRSYLTLGRERNISPTINRSPVSFNLHVYNIKIVSLLLCTKGFKYHFSDTNSNYQHVVNSFKYIPKQWIGLKMCSDWLLKLQNPLPSTSEQLIWVCAQKYCNHWRNKWVRIIFWTLLSNCCSLYPIQTHFFSKHLFTSMSVTVSVDIYHAAVQLGKYPPLNSSTSVNNC